MMASPARNQIQSRRHRQRLVEAVPCFYLNINSPQVLGAIISS
jgi:hypothetical protein